MRAGQEAVRAEAGAKNLEIRITTWVKITKNFNHQPDINGIYSGNNLHKIKETAYIINLDVK